MKERSLDFIGFPLHFVTTEGRVYHSNYHQLGIKKEMRYGNSHGYKNVTLQYNGNKKCITVHRLVAMCFLDNPNNLTQINHKDENKHNNNVYNLEYCSPKYNNSYGTRLKRCSASKSIGVVQYDINGNKIAEFKSIKDATKSVNGSNGNIVSCCKGKQKTSYGFVWKYKEENYEE